MPPLCYPTVVLLIPLSVLLGEAAAARMLPITMYHSTSSIGLESLYMFPVQHYLCSGM